MSILKYFMAFKDLSLKNYDPALTYESSLK